MNSDLKAQLRELNITAAKARGAPGVGLWHVRGPPGAPGPLSPPNCVCCSLRASTLGDRSWRRPESHHHLRPRPAAEVFPENPGAPGARAGEEVQREARGLHCPGAGASRRVAAVRACVGRVAGRGSQRVRETRGAAAGSPPAAKTRLLGKPPDAGKD